MPTNKIIDVQEQIKSIATELGIEDEKAIALAKKCYDDVYWRPYGGATSFAEIEEAEATRRYSYQIDDEAMKLRGIIENVTLTSELNNDAKITAIKAAANDFETRINSIDIEYEEKELSLLDKVKDFLLSNKVIKKEGDKWVVYSKTGKRLGTHSTRKAAVQQLRAIEANKEIEANEIASNSFKIFRDKETDEFRWISFSSNAFEDKEKELFSTKALEEAVDYAEKNDERGPLMVYHIPGTEIGKCDFQAVQGRFLIESGIFDDTELGNKALEYFLSTNDQYQVSIGYKYIEGDEKDGTYDWLRFRERSVCPSGTAANPWTEFQIVGGKEMDEQHKSTLIKMFGEETANGLIEKAESKTKELEANGVRHKADPKTEETADDAEKFVRQLAKNLGIDEEKALEEAKKVASSYSEDDEEEDKKKKDDKKEDETSGDSKLVTEMAQLLADIAEKVDVLASEVKELKKSDDEKVNAIAMPKINASMFRASESESNLMDENKAKELLGDVEREINPATKYVEDILGPLSNGRVAV